MSLKSLFLAVGLSVLPTAVPAQTYLEPTNTTLDRYDSRLRAVLQEGFRDDVKARALVVPSFQPERLIGLRRRAAAWEIFAIKPQKQIWQFEIVDMMKDGQIQTLGPDGRSQDQSEEIRELEAQLPPRPTDVGLNRCSIALDENVGATIMQVWSHMLSETREPDTIGLDGVTYYFSMVADGHERSAQAWTPREGSRVGQFVELTDAMDAFCQTKDRNQVDRMTALAKNILEEE